MVWHEIFPTHEVEKLHHFIKIVQGDDDQIVYGVFCQTFTKSC